MAANKARRKPLAFTLVPLRAEAPWSRRITSLNSSCRNVHSGTRRDVREAERIASGADGAGARKMLVASLANAGSVAIRGAGA